MYMKCIFVKNQEFVPLMFSIQDRTFILKFSERFYKSETVAILKMKINWLQVVVEIFI